jgi:hypothetical protein
MANQNRPPSPTQPDPDLSTAPPPMFLQPPPPPMPGPSTPDSPSSAARATGSDGSSPSAVPTPPIPTELLKLRKGRAAAFTAIARGAFQALGGLLNMQLAADADDFCFIPDDDDEAMVPPPVGRLAARKIPIGKSEDDFTDLEDVGQAVIGLGAWGLKGFTEWAKARREKKRTDPARGGQAVYDGTGDAGGEPPQ